MNTITSAVTPLLQRMLEDMRTRKLGPRTQEAYIRAVRKLAATCTSRRTRPLWRICATSNATWSTRCLAYDAESHTPRPAILPRRHAGAHRTDGPACSRSSCHTSCRWCSARRRSRDLITAARNVKHEAALSVVYGAACAPAKSST